MGKVRIQGIPSSMQAAVVRELRRPYSITQIPTPTYLNDHEILIKVAVASFCHTDLMILDGEMLPEASKLPGSHEPTGTVVAIGEGVDASIFKPGTRIAATGNLGPCGICRDCKGPSSMAHYCRFPDGFLGISKPGAFAEYCVVDDRYSIVLPDNLSFVSAAPLTCAGLTAWRGLKLSGAKEEGDSVCIVGSGGGLGNLAIQFCKAKGFKTIGLEARDVGIEASKKSGVDMVVDVRKGREHVLQQVYGATRGTLATTTIVLSDHEEATGLGCAVTQEHGTLVQLAQPETVEIPFRELIFRDIRIVGSLLGSAEDWKDLIAFVEKHKIKGETKTFSGLQSLEEIEVAAREGRYPGKMVVVLDEEAVKADMARGAF
ncbi:GroES-like protein [Atractiella rhizophila]|nr:GroES-like protein [Atractiella rhizophila]